MYTVLHDVRRRAGLTCNEVGEYLGVAGSVVSRYDTGSISPDTKTIRKLAELYNMNSWELLEIMDGSLSPDALWDYTRGDVGVYHECTYCDARVLLPPGTYLCPSCGKDTLVLTDIGNGLQGVAATGAVLSAGLGSRTAYNGDPASLEPLRGTIDWHGEELHDWHGSCISYNGDPASLKPLSGTLRGREALVDVLTQSLPPTALWMMAEPATSDFTSPEDYKRALDAWQAKKPNGPSILDFEGR